MRCADIPRRRDGADRMRGAEVSARKRTLRRGARAALFCIVSFLFFLTFSYFPVFQRFATVGWLFASRINKRRAFVTTVLVVFVQKRRAIIPNSMMAEEQGDFCISIPAAGGYEQLVRESLTSSGTSHSIGAQSRLFEIPAEQHVTVAVSAAGVNYADIVIRFGMYSSAKEYVGWPITPGFEFSGTVRNKFTLIYTSN